MFCYNCGKELQDGTKYCPYCGTMVEATSSDTGLKHIEYKRIVPVICGLLLVLLLALLGFAIKQGKVKVFDGIFYPNGREVEWHDSVLEQAVREYLQMPTEAIHTKDLDSITSISYQDVYNRASISFGTREYVATVNKDVYPWGPSASFIDLTLDITINDDTANDKWIILDDRITTFLDLNEFDNLKVLVVTASYLPEIVNNNNIQRFSWTKSDNGAEVLDLNQLSGFLNLKQLYISGAPSGSVPQNLYSLESLEVLTPAPEGYRMRITDDFVQSISNLTKLKYLYLDKIGSDISAFDSLSELETLRLTFDSPVQNISCLQSLSNLKTLTLSASRLDKDPTLAMIKSLPSLKILDIGYSNIEDFSVVADLVSKCPLLESLNVSGNFGAANINALVEVIKVLPNIQWLNMSYIDESYDFSQVSSIRQLRGLELDGNKGTDINKLRELTNLERLNVGSCDLTDLSFLESLKELTYLNISGNLIENFAPLKYCEKLERLDLESCNVIDAGALEALPNLKAIDMSYAETIIAPDKLNNLVSLEVLRAQWVHMSDLTYVQNLRNLQYLDFGYNEVYDITPLSGMTQMKYLYIADNNITDLTPLMGMTQLVTLNIAGNQISDLNPLSNLKTLTSVSLANNESDRPLDYSALDFVKSLYIS